MNLNLPEIKRELIGKSVECQRRGLAHSFKWLSEILYALRYFTMLFSGLVMFSYRKVKAAAITQKAHTELPDGEDEDDESSSFLMAKAYFDLKEYDRCAHFTQAAADM